MSQKLINKQTQKHNLSLSQSMKKSLDILKMNERELLEAIREITASNPFLEYHPAKDLNGMLEESFPLQRTLKEDLYLQLHTLRHVYDEVICSYIIESLDDHGFFRESLSVAAGIMSCSREVFEKQLKIIQSLEPAGVGASSQLESVKIQLERRGELEALHLLKTYPRALLDNDYQEIRKKEKWPAEKVRILLRVIRSCKLNPCYEYDNSLADLRLPDFEIQKHQDSLEIVMPRSGYLSMDLGYLENVKKDPAFRSFFEDANFFIDSLNKRSTTLLLLMNTLVSHQKNHFLYNDELEPCTLQDIAKETGFHESTVSRTLSNKFYIWGEDVYPVKDLFVSRTRGGTSRDSVLKALQMFISSEDPLHPFSDQELAEELEGMGMEVSRRAIAKYRGQLGIPSSGKRKKK